MAKITIPQGILNGGKTETNNGFEYYEFLGVPYAKPPVGDLRFKSPQSPEPWNGERDATVIDESNISCQIDFKSHNFVGSEDCLYLNVYTPKLPSPSENNFPVMVFIHGGGFLGGNGIVKSETGPGFLIENDVVIVTINYRLSVLGFLSLDVPEVAGNMGLKDQVKALEWIKQNIEYFNGDCNNVTIFGSSAGAASVEYLILSPMANDLFHKAILQSGSVLNTWTLNTEPKKTVDVLLHNLDYKGDVNNKQQIYEYLMKISAEQLILASTKPSADMDSKKLKFMYAPVVENDFSNGEAFLIRSPQTMLKQGELKRVPMLKGFCNKEASLRKMIGNSSVQELAITKNFIDYLPFNLHSDDYELCNANLQKAYLDNKNTDEETALDFLSDLDFISGIWISGKILAKADVPLYVYEFSYVGNLNMTQIFKLNVNGAGHGDECSYLFTSQLSQLAGKFDETDTLIIKRTTKLWTDFAKTGNPTPSTSDIIPLSWPLFSQESPAYFNIDKELKIKSDYEPQKMAIFEDILNKYLQ